jgi:hypothetical protein
MERKYYTQDYKAFGLLSIQYSIEHNVSETESVSFLR